MVKTGEEDWMEGKAFSVREERRGRRERGRKRERGRREPFVYQLIIHSNAYSGCYGY